jgi:hypothetical protein
MRKQTFLSKRMTLRRQRMLEDLELEKRKLYSLCREILFLCSELQIQLVVRHIPGHLNVLADTLSRSLAPVNTEWELLQVIFNAISHLWCCANSLDLDAVFFLSVEIVDSL